ncbi:hypothetical protein ACEN4P_09210 [Marinilactibacillus psychrotolerans]|uniref:hypothetical protein n=1 Tax=Marinilactibacillus psychrotolerans TaxID=191770 RepID=UPI003888F9BF
MSNTELTNFFRKFDIETLAEAIYAITAWPSNRPYIGAVDTMNKCLLKIEKEQGTVKINTYIDFQNLFNEINKYLKKNLMFKEDFTSDLGEVKFFSNDSFKDIIIANGSEDIYEACFIIDEMVKGNENFQSLWQEILKYEDFVISKLYSNEYSYSNEFECPPESFFNSVQKNFHSFKNQKLKLFFKEFESSNEELYSFFSPINGYPIFLPMLKETFIEKVESELAVSLTNKLVWNALIRRLQRNFISPIYKNDSYLCSINIYDKNLKKGTFFDNSFAVWNGNNIVVFVSDELEKDSLNLIKKGILERHFSFQGVLGDGNIKEVEFLDDMNIIIQKINTNDISPNINKLMSFSKSDDVYMDAKGVLGIINSAFGLEEIVNFIIYNKTSRDKIINMSGLTAYFQVWKDSDRVINEGASEVSLFVPAYESVERIIELFKYELKNYPFDMSNTFFNVHYWNVIKDTKSDLTLNSKSGTGSTDIFKSKEKYLVYQELHFIIEDISERALETIDSFHEIITNGFAEQKSLILSLFEKKFLEINLISENVLIKNARNKEIIKTKYCKKIIINTDEDSQILLVRPFWEKIFEDNLSNETMQFENELLLSFIEGASFYDMNTIKKELEKSSSKKRTSSIGQIEIPFYIEPRYSFSVPDNYSFKNVRKLISKIIKETGLEPKVYNESEIVGLVRQFRNKVRDDLIEKIERFNTVELHKKLLNSYSAILFQIKIHKDRLDEFDKPNNLRPEVLDRFRVEAIKLREESRTYKQVLEYLIEENLVNEKISNDTPSGKQVDELIAYSKWIMDFQVISDSINYGAIGWNQLEVREDYVVEIEETGKYLEDTQLLKHLKYKYGDFSIRDTKIDKKMINVVDKNFQDETGISFESLVTTLTFLYSNFIVNDFLEDEDVKIDCNIVDAPINYLATLFIQETDLIVEKFFKVLEFINIDTTEITDSSGMIPVWEKKKRKSKISAQPILIESDRVIYSPSSLYELQQSWIQGVMNFILPYNVGLENTTKAVDNWKGYYESKIVEELSLLFNKDIYDVYIDKELYKLDPKGNHPKNLGDYDLIVINKEKHEVLLFEVKYMRLSQTMKDSLGDQGKYFLNKKAKAKHFVRRTEYFEANDVRILSNLGFKDKFVIKKYFVTNKNIRSFFKEYPFEIISFNEFKEVYFPI